MLRFGNAMLLGGNMVQFSLRRMIHHRDTEDTEKWHRANRKEGT